MSWWHQEMSAGGCIRQGAHTGKVVGGRDLCSWGWAADKTGDSQWGWSSSLRVPGQGHFRSIALKQARGPAAPQALGFCEQTAGWLIGLRPQAAFTRGSHGVLPPFIWGSLGCVWLYVGVVPLLPWWTRHSILYTVHTLTQEVHKRW